MYTGRIGHWAGDSIFDLVEGARLHMRLSFHHDVRVDEGVMYFRSLFSPTRSMAGGSTPRSTVRASAMGKEQDTGLLGIVADTLEGPRAAGRFAAVGAVAAPRRGGA
jgi:hypothetical protein